MKQAEIRREHILATDPTITPHELEVWKILKLMTSTDLVKQLTDDKIAYQKVQKAIKKLLDSKDPPVTVTASKSPARPVSGASRRPGAPKVKKKKV